MRSIAILASILALLLPASALAYRVFLKDGSSIAARDKYEIRGDTVLIALASGGFTEMELADIDIEMTDEYNEMTNSSAGAIVVDTQGGRLFDREQDRQRTLQDLIRERQGQETTEEPDDAPTRARVITTLAGYSNLFTYPRQLSSDRRQVAALEHWFRRKGLHSFSVFDGTQEDRFLVELTTNTEGEVLRALEAVCKAWAEWGDDDRITLEALELVLLTSTRERAGQFVLSGDNAPLLGHGRMAVGDFYVEYVQF